MITFVHGADPTVIATFDAVDPKLLPRIVMRTPPDPDDGEIAVILGGL